MDVDEIIDDINILYFVDDLAIPRIMPDRINPLEKYGPTEIRERYRFSGDVIVSFILPLIREDLDSFWQRGCPVPSIIQLCTALQYYGSGDLQRSVGDLNNMRQGTVSKIIKRVSEALTRKLSQFIHFPIGNEVVRVKQDFYQMASFPHCVGCIDGTHISIMCPDRTRGEIFRNRKGKFSINVQVIGGPQLQIYDIVARWPGSAHDSRIFNESNIKNRFDVQEVEGILLGDSGYPQLRYLYTPLREPVMPQRPQVPVNDPDYILQMFAYREELRDFRAAIRYNRAHKSTRNSVECLFGLWKRRFLCIHRTLNTTKLRNILRIITATAVLYNIGIASNDENDFPDIVDEQPEADPPVVNNADGVAIRELFIEQYFKPL